MTDTKFKYLGLCVNTQDMTLYLPQDKMQVIKVQATKVASCPTFRGVMRLLELTDFASMALLLVWLEFHPSQFFLWETYRTSPYLFKKLKHNLSSTRATLQTFSNHNHCPLGGAPSTESICEHVHKVLALSGKTNANRYPKEGTWGPHEQTIFQRQVAREKAGSCTSIYQS